MAFKMKGPSLYRKDPVSPMKQENLIESEYDAQGNYVGTRFPTAGEELKDNRYITSGGEFTSRPMSSNEQKQANYATMFTKGKGDNLRYGDKNIPGRRQWIRENYGRGLSKKEQRKAEIAFYKAHPPSSFVVGGGGGGQQQQSTQQTTETTPSQRYTIEEKGDDPTELTKAVSKGYFNRGQGSEYYKNRPVPSDFDVPGEYVEAITKFDEEFKKKYPNAKL
jgi:hypothetical protein